MRTNKQWTTLSLALGLAVASVSLGEVVNSVPNADPAAPAVPGNRERSTNGIANQGNTLSGTIDTGRDSTLTRDTTQAPGTLRASNLIGTNVYSPNNKSLGEIKDVVLDKNNQRVGYVVISYGGLAGMGDKYFAMPYKMIQYSGAGAGTGSKAIVNLDEQVLRNAPGFDQDHWPTDAKADYFKKLDQYYSQHQANASDRLKDAGDTAQDALHDMGKQASKSAHDTAGAMKDQSKAHSAQVPSAQPIPAGAQVDSTGLQWTRRVSSLVGANVEAPDGTNLGEVKDLVLDWNNGNVKYAVLSYGGMLGFGDKLFAVPMDAFGTQADSSKLVLNASKDQLKNAPGFNKDQWPDMADPQWQKDVGGFYGRQGGHGNETGR